MAFRCPVRFCGVHDDWAIGHEECCKASPESTSCDLGPPCAQLTGANAATFTWLFERPFDAYMERRMLDSVFMKATLKSMYLEYVAEKKKHAIVTKLTMERVMDPPICPMRVVWTIVSML